mmetsp:Transcript_35864/g.58488  ORF Transcript_35864/g.58488 Transcript_35864/m.58488 type:complete len:86 (+) Transcript_35864:351-608(+)
MSSWEAQEKRIDAILRSSRIGRHAIVAAIIPTINNSTVTKEDDATLKALWTGETADPILSSRASLRNLHERVNTRDAFSEKCTVL